MAGASQAPGNGTRSASLGNRLLALLPEPDMQTLSVHLEPVELKVGATLIAPDASITHVYFVSAGLVSLVQLLENGKLVETGIVGREGMVGALVPLGAAAFSHEAVVQIEGRGLRMAASILRVEVALRPALRDILLRYVQALFLQVAQSVACNSQHTLRNRLARWLSMAADCTGATDLALTHELMSTMLGVRRSGVTEGVAALKRDGLIIPYHGGVRILDRPRLRNDACECYRAVRQAFDRLLGPEILSD
jgi:CRP-like cAMP-binding protein